MILLKQIMVTISFHVTDKKEAKEANFEDHKEEIKQTLFDQEISTEYSTWITEQREKLEIENTLDERISNI